MGILVPSDTRPDLLALSAFGYQLLARERTETVVIFLPAPPNVNFNGLCIPNMEAVEAAVGSFKIDTALAGQFQAIDFPVAIDNSLFYPAIPPLLETQLAALKFVLQNRSSKIKILPILVKFRDVNSDVKDYAPVIAEKIKDLGSEGGITFVIAANLTRAASEDALIQTDKLYLTHIRNLDIDGVIGLRKSQLSMDGSVYTPDMDVLAMGVLTLKWLGADHAEILAYAHSAQMILTKDKNSPLSYAAAGFSSDSSYPPKIPHVERDKMVKIFGELFRTDILAMTRQTCASILDPTAAKPPALVNIESSKKWPVYVTLYDPKGNLAGQAGSYAAVGPLEESIRRFTLEAVRASQPVLTKDTAANYVVDVSIPYGFNFVTYPDELLPMQNGVIVHGERKTSGVHPDAWRTYPDPHQLLGALCTKLGMVPWAYATKEARVESFRVLSFNEKEPFQDLSGLGKKKKKKGEEDETPADTGGAGAFPF